MQNRPPYNPLQDPYILMYMMKLQKEREAAANSGGGSDTGSLAKLAGLGYGGYKLAKSAGLIGDSATAASTASDVTPGAMSAVSSAAPSVDLATIQSLSNGGNGMQSVAPLSGQMSQAPAETSISNFAGEATPYLGAAGTAIGAYNAYQGIRKGNPAQAGLGGVGAGLGINAMGYALGPYGWAAMAAAPIALSLTGGKKSAVQKQRDSGRSAAIGAGYADKNYQTKLADGSTFDIGKDGGFTYQNAGKNIDGKTSRHAYDVDFSNPLSGDTVSKISPYIRKLLGEGASEKALSDLTGQYVNAVQSNANDRASVDKNIAAIFGMGPLSTNSPRPQAPTRSKTRSPGIGLDGRRIQY